MPPPGRIICVLFEGFEPLDLAGPIELLGHLEPPPGPGAAPPPPGARVPILYAAEARGPVLAGVGGFQVVATHSFDDLLAPALPGSGGSGGGGGGGGGGWEDTWLLVPGGRGVQPLLPREATAGGGAAKGQSPVVSFVREAGRRAALLASVCTGAAIVAAAGRIPPGAPATTNKRAWGYTTHGYPGAAGPDWRWRSRWARAGRVVTSAGVAAGMDMAWALIRDEVGEGVADGIARLIEYEPHRDPDWDPFAAGEAPGPSPPPAPWRPPPPP